MPGHGVGEGFKAFTDEEIKAAWKDAVESLAGWGAESVTEAYLKDEEMAG